MKVDVTYGFKCTAAGCNVTAVDHHDDCSSYHTPPPRLPEGWYLFGVLVFCPRHTVLLTVDGEACPIESTPEEG